MCAACISDIHSLHAVHCLSLLFECAGNHGFLLSCQLALIMVCMRAACPNNTPWEASGVVVRITSSEEIALELHTGKNDVVPSSETLGFAAELTWNSTAYDRMQQGLKTFAENSECMSDLLYHQILGHAPDMPRLQHRRPAAFQAPNMPVPNHSQVAALEAALAQPFTLIQGPPGTGKTITSTTLVWLLHQAAGGKVLMAAPSNVAVDHLAEKISSTGLKVCK